MPSVINYFHILCFFSDMLGSFILFNCKYFHIWKFCMYLVICCGFENIEQSKYNHYPHTHIS